MPCTRRAKTHARHGGRYIALEPMGIFYVQYHAEPTPESHDFESCGGAYVNCWVKAASIDAAARTASAVMADTGWNIVGVEEACCEVTEDWYSEDDEGREYYEQAANDGECYVFHKWPIEPQEGGDVH